MTTIYTYAKAKQSFASVVNKACIEGQVKIQKDDRIFILMPESKNTSPLDIKGVNFDIIAKDIISFIHEARTF